MLSCGGVMTIFANEGSYDSGYQLSMFKDLKSQHSHCFFFFLNFQITPNVNAGQINSHKLLTKEQKTFQMIVLKSWNLRDGIE